MQILKLRGWLKGVLHPGWPFSYLEFYKMMFLYEFGLTALLVGAIIYDKNRNTK